MATDETPSKTEAPRRSTRSGAIAFAASIALILWVMLAAWLALLSIGNEVAAVTATIVFFASWAIVPVLIVVVLVFAVIALLLNPVPGKIMGALAIVLPIVAAALYWNSIGGFQLVLP